jgi:hypothetical protein
MHLLLTWLTYLKEEGFFQFKGIDRPFGRGVESRLIQSLLINWRLGHFFSSHLKWISSQDQQKTNRRRLIIYKVTLTGQSHFMRIFLQSKVTLRDYTNSVKWMYAIGPKILWFNWMKVMIAWFQIADKSDFFYPIYLVRTCPGNFSFRSRRLLTDF